MSEPEPQHTTRGDTLALRLTAVLLLALGVFPLANHLGVADPQAWWTRAWHNWLLWALLVPALALLLVRGRTPFWERQVAAWRSRLLDLPSRQFGILVGALACLLSLAIGWLMFGWRGSTIDELSQLWQAHLLASGRLFATAEPHPEFFSTLQTVSYQGRWFAHFPIGGPLLQSAGLLVHAPWLVNPLLAGISTAAIFRFASSIGGDTEARITALLVTLSPFVLIIAGSRLDHAGTLAALWIAIAALPGWLAATPGAHALRNALRNALVIGVALGCATIIRPYDGAVAVLVIGLFQLATVARRRELWRSLLLQAIAGTIPIALLLLVNRALTGHPLTFAYDVLNGPDHRPGFHASPLGFHHTPVVGLFRISTYLMRLNAALLGWPAPAVLIVAIAMLTWRRANHWDTLLVALLLATFGAYALYWGDGSFHGPRFLFQVAPIFLLFVARFPAAVRSHLRNPVMRGAVSLLIPLWLAIAWLLPQNRYLPFGVWGLTVGTREAEPASDLLVREVQRQHLTHALVFVQDGWDARLAARLRALAVPPLQAQTLAASVNPCTLQQRLDSAERQRARLSGAASGPAACSWDSTHALGRGLDLARLLPSMPLDSLGRIGGDVVYAREFGARDSLLRGRFGDRRWYAASVVPRADSLAISLQPLVPSP